MRPYFGGNEYAVPQYSDSSEIVIEEETCPAKLKQFLAKEPEEFDKKLQEEILERYKNTLETLSTIRWLLNLEKISTKFLHKKARKKHPLMPPSIFYLSL